MSKKPKFLFDLGVGNVVESWMKDQKFDVLSIRKINPRMSDVDILELAAKENRIVITMDKDFGELVFNQKKKHKGVLLLRLDDATSDEKLVVVREIFDKFLSKLSSHFSVYQNETLRIR